MTFIVNVIRRLAFAVILVPLAVLAPLWFLGTAAIYWVFTGRMWKPFEDYFCDGTVPKCFTWILPTEDK